MRCFSSTIAKWDDREDEEAALDDDLEGVWLGGFEGFADLCELISLSEFEIEESEKWGNLKVGGRGRN